MRTPLWAAGLVFVLGFLVIWLIQPIGNPCPDRGALPQGSSTSSSPSFAPPGTRICTYLTPDGTQATFRCVPWLDWFVLALLAGLAAAALRRAASNAAGAARATRAPSPARKREPRTARDRSRKVPSTRDDADRERARRERAERARRAR